MFKFKCANTKTFGNEMMKLLAQVKSNEHNKKKLKT
jgi:hypothetical protein